MNCLLNCVLFSLRTYLHITVDRARLSAQLCRNPSTQVVRAWISAQLMHKVVRAPSACTAFNETHFQSTEEGVRSFELFLAVS